jgi:hypothetical protein
MFRLSLVLRKKNENELVLTLPPGFRIMFAVIVVFLAGSMISTGGVSAGSVTLTVLSLLAGLYKERWSFAKEARIIEHQTGLLFPFLTKSFEMDEVETFILSRSATWRPPAGRIRKSKYDDAAQPQRKATAMSSFGLITKDGKAHTIEIRKSRTNEIMEDNAQEIAEFCGIPFKLQE